MGIEHHLLAYFFDDAIGMWARDIEGKLQELDKKGKPVHRLENLLGIPIQTKKMTRGELARFKSLG